MRVRAKKGKYGGRGDGPMKYTLEHMDFRVWPLILEEMRDMLITKVELLHVATRPPYQPRRILGRGLR